MRTEEIQRECYGTTTYTRRPRALHGVRVHRIRRERRTRRIPHELSSERSIHDSELRLSQTRSHAHNAHSTVRAFRGARKMTMMCAFTLIVEQRVRSGLWGCDAVMATAMQILVVSQIASAARNALFRTHLRRLKTAEAATASLSCWTFGLRSTYAAAQHNDITIHHSGAVPRRHQFLSPFVGAKNEECANVNRSKPDPIVRVQCTVQ